MIRTSLRKGGGLSWVAPLLLACGAGAPDRAEAPRPERHTVEIRNMAFHPAELRVHRGDTVVWVNRDLVPHTATAADSAWTSPPLARGERWHLLVRAHAAGSYLCVFHPVMEAHLIVDPPPSTEE